MLPVTDLLNKPVITRDGRILGRLTALRVDEEWKIPLLAVSLNRDVAEKVEVRKPLFGSPRVFLDPSEVAALGDNVILDRSLAEVPESFLPAGKGMEAQRLLGRKVHGEEDYYFGDLSNLAVDSGRWRISEVLVDVRKKAADEMGLPMTVFGTFQAKVPVQKVEGVADHLRLAMGPDEFKRYVVKERSRT